MSPLRRLPWPSLPLVLALLCLGSCSGGEGTDGGVSAKFTTPDGWELHASWFPSAADGAPPAPAVICLHMMNRTRADYTSLAKALHERGVAVLSVDLRGHGESTQKAGKTLKWGDFEKSEYLGMIVDIEAAAKWLGEQKGVDPKRIGIVGASIGANAALNYAADHAEVKTVVLLSPGLDYHGVKTEDAMKRYGDRPVFLAASKADEQSAGATEKLHGLGASKDKVLKMYDGDAHGTLMFGKDPALEGEIREWLGKRL